MLKNPLRHRFLRDLKADFGKHAVIFLFLVMLISLVSGYLVADNSLYDTYQKSFERYRIEDGHFVSAVQLDAQTRKSIETDNQITLYDLFYREQKEGKVHYRVYTKRDAVNTECLMAGKMPTAADEIAVDRKFAENAELKPGDTLRLAEKDWKVSGLVALSDYSALFYSNADMVHDTVHFTVAIVTAEGFDRLDASELFYSYAFLYETRPANTVEEKARADDLLDNIKTKIPLTSYMPRYENKAIQFTGNDLGNDKVMFMIFYYIVMVIITFIFAVTASSAVTKEACVIGTLRALGYNRGELIRHYLTLPILVTLAAAVIGNILGYTILEEHMAGLYYNSYSLTRYEKLWNAEAFFATTVAPIVVMLVIHVGVLWRKLRLQPLRFLRRDLSAFRKRKTLRLRTEIPFLHRFRLKILLQNWANYLTLFFGIVFASMIVIFGMMFSGLMDEYAESIEQSMISKFQYILKMPVEIENAKAEKYSVATLKTQGEGFVNEDITVYGIQKDSRYVKARIPKDQVLISQGMMEKYSLRAGDTIHLKEPYGDRMYPFTIAGSYPYDAMLCVFMNHDHFKDAFERENGDFNGYFSNEELPELKKETIASVITKDDLTKLSAQLKLSLGDFMKLFKWFGVLMFLLLMYLLSKQIVEKNARSISLVKILGFSDHEIGRLYIVATSLVVVASLLASVPIVHSVLEVIFQRHVYRVMTGYLPLRIADGVYIQTILMGMATYVVVACMQLQKIRKIPKSEALKDME